jgi:hypothetical protein
LFEKEQILKVKISELDIWGVKKVTIGKTIVSLGELIMAKGKIFKSSIKDDNDKVSGEICIRVETIKEDNKVV